MASSVSTQGRMPAGKPPLEGSWRGAPERCYRTEGLPQGIGLCIRALTRRRPLGGTPLRHGSAVPPLLKERLWGPLPERGRLPLRGAGAERLRGVTAPMACRKVSACASGADALPPLGRHTSPSRLRRAPRLPLSLPGPRCGPPRQVAAQPLRSLFPPLAALPCGPLLKERLWRVLLAHCLAHRSAPPKAIQIIARVGEIARPQNRDLS